MLEEKDAIRSKQGMRKARMIWTAMILSLGVYLVVAHCVAKDIHLPLMPQSIHETLRFVFMGVGAALLILAHPVRKFLLGSNLVPLSSGSGLAANMDPGLGKYLPAFLLALAMCEGVGILGLVLFFLSGDFQILYVFMAFAGLGMYYQRPRMEELEEVMRSRGLDSGPVA